MPPIIRHFFDSDTHTFSYVVSDSITGKCAIIDSVLNFNFYTGHLSTQSADKMIEYIHQNQLTVEWILDTHIHADHLTACAYLRNIVGGKAGIGKHIIDALNFWIPIFNSHLDTPLDASHFDHLFDDNESFYIGNMKAKIIETPGHTRTCISLLIDRHLFVGDTLLMPDIGTARTDFPGADAATLYDSIQKLYQFPDDTIVHLCHDYPPEHRDISCTTTIGEQKEKNILLNGKTSKQDFIHQRHQRDRNKQPPKLLLPSIQVNLRAGELGHRENNQRQYIKIPINAI